MFRLKSWLLLHVKKYKSCCWRTFVIRKCNIAKYLHSAGRYDHDDEVTMYLLTYPTKKLVSNQRLNESYSRSSFIVIRSISKLNHTVMNQKQGYQMQFSLEKKTRKKKVTSFNPSYQSMDCVIKWGIRFINSTRNFVICLKMFIMQQRANSWAETKEWVAKTDSASATS